MTKIYTLSDPVTNEVKYVGKTITDLNERLRCHLKDKGINKRINWIKSLNKKGLIPVIELIDECEDLDSDFIECYWINQFKSWGFDLKNMTNGGDGGVLSKETKRKIGAANSKLSEDDMKKVIELNKSGKYTQKEIGEYFGVSRKAISNRLQKFNIPIVRIKRPLTQSQLNSLRIGQLLPTNNKQKEILKNGRDYMRLKRYNIPLPSKENF